MDKHKIVKSAVKHLLAFIAAGTVVYTPQTAAATQSQEKCYGIVKAGMNDCATKTASCASSATKDNQKDAFIFLPKGTCEKITGGSLTAETDK
jgi:uncharacterized membrane protein